MLNVIYFLMALVATGVTVFYTWFYQVTIPGAQYNYTYAAIALTAAIIFGALWLAGNLNKETQSARILTE